MGKPSVECVLDIRAGLGECPVWDSKTQSLFWVDIEVGRLNRFDPASGSNQAWTVSEQIGSFALWHNGVVLAALKSGLYRYELASGKLDPLAQPEQALPGNRMNDGRCDPKGRFWVGSMGDPPDPARPSGTLYRYDGVRGCVAMASGFVVSNGLAFSPDGRTLYHSDSHRSVRSVWAWDLDPDGRIHNRRLFIDTNGMPGRPDGAAVDADGCYWMAANDGWEVVRFTPKGEIDRRIALPVAKPSMLAFGGPNFDVIYVTSIRPVDAEVTGQPLAGSLFAIAGTGVTGLPEPRFGG